METGKRDIQSIMNRYTVLNRGKMAHQKKHIAIIIPYRDPEGNGERTRQLNRFMTEMNARFETFNCQSPSPTVSVFVVEQSSDERKFNRGKLLNIGFRLAVDYATETNISFDSFIFHDVDLIPSKELICEYATAPGQIDNAKKGKVLHIANVWGRYVNSSNSQNNVYLGGITAFSRAQFEEINGFPNNFWGWGGEDDEVAARCKNKKIQIQKLQNINNKYGEQPIEDIEGDGDGLDLDQKLNFLKQNNSLKCQRKRELLGVEKYYMDLTRYRNNTGGKKNNVQLAILRAQNQNKCVPKSDVNGLSAIAIVPNHNDNDDDDDTYVQSESTLVNKDNSVFLHAKRYTVNIGLNYCREDNGPTLPDWMNEDASQRFEYSDVVPLDYSDVRTGFRYVFTDEQNSDAWKDVLEQYPNFTNNIPKFDDKASCVDFVKNTCRIHSSPDENTPYFQHSITTFVGWNQIKTYLLPEMNKYYGDFASLYAFDFASASASASVSVNTATKKSDEKKRDFDDLMRPVETRLNLSVHQSITKDSTIKTLIHLFKFMRCGILVMIRNGNVVVFAPFVNSEYENNWSSELNMGVFGADINDQAAAYYKQKQTVGGLKGDENYLPNVKNWWLNAGVISNVHNSLEEKKRGESQWWGDSYLLQLKDMLLETCRQREIPDCDFFLNKRDYPQFKFSYNFYRKPNQDGFMADPYGFVRDLDDKNPQNDVRLPDLIEETDQYSNDFEFVPHKKKFRLNDETIPYTPVCSFYTTSDVDPNYLAQKCVPRFSDIPIPPTEDWESAIGKVFPASFMYRVNRDEITDAELGVVLKSEPRDLFAAQNFDSEMSRWENKIFNTAFFRGSATGASVHFNDSESDFNQRLLLCMKAYETTAVIQDEMYTLDHEYKNYVDAKLTGWNTRDKKVCGRRMQYITKIKELNMCYIDGVNTHYVPIYEQMKYKYLIYVEGHSAACRYGFMMKTGSVILKVKSRCMADTMWYFPLLKDMHDHIEVKSDLSDLFEKIKWCRNNDATCKQIAENARKIYDDYIAKDGILNYMEGVLTALGDRCHFGEYTGKRNAAEEAKKKADDEAKKKAAEEAKKAVEEAKKKAEEAEEEAKEAKKTAAKEAKKKAAKEAKKKAAKEADTEAKKTAAKEAKKKAAKEAKEAEKEAKKKAAKEAKEAEKAAKEAEKKAREAKKDAKKKAAEEAKKETDRNVHKSSRKRAMSDDNVHDSSTKRTKIQHQEPPKVDYKIQKVGDREIVMIDLLD